MKTQWSVKQLCNQILFVLILLGLHPWPAESQSPGLVAAFSFNEGTGTTVNDISGNGITGTISGATWTTQGKYGNALSFNGASSYVELGNPSLLQITGSMTWSAWVNAAANPPDDGQIIAKSDNNSGWQLKTSPDTGPHTFGVAVSASSSSHTQRYSTTVRSLNTWYHVAGVYNATTQTLDMYVNGVLNNGTLSGTVPASQINSTVNVNIGRRVGGYYFNGLIDEVRVYNRALTPPEIQTDMNTPIGNPPPPGLSISPGVAALTFARTQQFTSNNGNVVWLVDGVLGGSASSGTITTSGLYTPPSAVGTHTVTVKTLDLLESANATVYIVNHPGVFTHHIDNFRTGANLNETVLTPANVTSTTFGKLFTYPIDGLSFSSPLYVANLNIPGQGFHNVVYVATEHNSVYAFDADGVSSSPLWHVSFLGPGVTTVPCADVGECGDIPNEIGITSTPVIDPASATLYVVAKTKEGTNYFFRLHALDISTGAEKFGGPVVIQATVPGTGVGSQGGQLPFLPLRENQRTALLLNNGVVYFAFASHGDVQPYHGWVFGYNATTLQQTFAFCVTPNNEGGGVWQSGGGLAADAAGNIYFATGDGTFTADVGGIDYGDSYVKLSPTGTVLDYFTPHDQLILDQLNLDLCAGGVLLLPDQPGPNPHLLIGSGKNATVYVVNRDSMGHFRPNNDSHAVQTLPNIFPNGTPEPGNFINPVYFNGTVYFSPVADNIQAFQLSNGLLITAPTSRSSELYTMPGGTLAISANGNTNGILWAVQRNGTTAPGVLYAYDPANLSTVFYNSNQAGSRDIMDFAAKYTMPLVVNGKVFVVTLSGLTMYGGISAGTTIAPAPPVLATPANGATGVVTNPTLTWNASTGATSYHLQVSTDPGFATTVVDQSNITTTSSAVGGLAGNTLFYWRVSASNSGGTSAYSTGFSFTTTAPPPPPPAPVLATPANGATGVATNATLTWNASTGATSYHLQVSTDPGFATTLVDQSNITTTSSTVTGLATNTLCYWRVSATNGGGTSAYSTAWSFTTELFPYGAVLYGQYCASCHGPLATSTKHNRTAAQIQAAIDANRGGVMGSPELRALTPTQVEAIAAALVTALPIQLGSFTGGVVSPNAVRLEWVTLSEVNNYGFEIQKSDTTQQRYQTIPNSFIPGHGTTNEPQHYSFIDSTVTSGVWYYRLKQIDLDGTIHYCDGVRVNVLTGVKEKETPTVFSLSQNYPNPWNPSTTIHYGLHQTSYVMLTVYNTLGQQVAQLVNEQQQAGYHDVVFRGDELASGVYFYRLYAGEFVQTKKLLLLK
ncbi:MAG: pyrrolo-quinoline quinone [Bacteroidetes bacterium]|nr:pyrrolo-quinoline quinone [Bacteroidota bacterium]